jgi:hypothetical protein
MSYFYDFWSLGPQFQSDVHILVPQDIYINLEFQVIWIISHLYPIRPIFITSGHLVHNFNLVSTIYCLKILKSRISGHMDHKKLSVSDVSHFHHFRSLGPQTHRILIDFNRIYNQLIQKI